MVNISVAYCSEETKELAQSFARKHSLTCVSEFNVSTPLVLFYRDEFLELKDTDKNISIHVDFISGELAHRQQYGGGRGQAIAKAIGLKQGTVPPYVLDVTAGLARDAFIIANLGCKVKMVEHSPVLVEMIQDAIIRAQESETFISILKRGFEIIHTNSIDYLKQLKKASGENHPDVIYLDPMFPERKKSASVKKNMQILQKLHGEDTDSDQLLNSSIKLAKKRVVVKRPKAAENLAGISPSYTVESKKTRYDIYLTNH